jgi:hypothetical protein
MAQIYVYITCGVLITVVFFILLCAIWELYQKVRGTHQKAYFANSKNTRWDGQMHDANKINHFYCRFEIGMQQRGEQGCIWI